MPFPKSQIFRGGRFRELQIIVASVIAAVTADDTSRPVDLILSVLRYSGVVFQSVEKLRNRHPRRVEGAEDVTFILLPGTVKEPFGVLGRGKGAEAELVARVRQRLDRRIIGAVLVVPVADYYVLIDLAEGGSGVYGARFPGAVAGRSRIEHSVAPHHRGYPA